MRRISIFFLAVLCAACNVSFMNIAPATSVATVSSAQRQRQYEERQRASARQNPWFAVDLPEGWRLSATHVLDDEVAMTHCHAGIKECITVTMTFPAASPRKAVEGARASLAVDEGWKVSAPKVLPNGRVFLTAESAKGKTALVTGMRYSPCGMRDACTVLVQVAWPRAEDAVGKDALHAALSTLSFLQ